METTKLQALIRNTLSDAPLRGPSADRAVHRLLAESFDHSDRPRNWHTRSLRTGHHSIAFICARDRGNEVVVRIAWSTSGAAQLDRQHDALAALGEVPTLEGWRELLPRILREGTIDGRQYVIESVMPGIDGRRASPERQANAMELIAEAISPMHNATSHRPAGRDAILADMVDAPLALMARACGLATRAPLARLGERLRQSMSSDGLEFSRVHGDLWAGNAILNPDYSRVTGLVDWESSLASALPAVDIVHLVLAHRDATGSGDNGRALCRLLDGRDSLDRRERDLLVRHGAGAPEVIELTDLLLLAWLQHVGHVLGDSKVWVPRLWLRRKVYPVLAVA